MIVKLINKSKYLVLLILGLLFVGEVNYGQGELAIPEARGFAKSVRGAYDGSKEPTILYVDRLTDDYGNNGANKGALRWCLTRNYPRIILFEVSGYINLTTYIRVYNDNVSIYGQTAPSPGVTVSGDDVIDFRCNNVIVQHLRFRSSYNGSEQKDALTITAGSNVFIDHCSFSYSEDECLGVGASFKSNITVQNCIFSWPLHYNTGKGFLINAGTADSISLINSAFVHCADRTPFPNAENYTAFETVNTITYNAAYFGQSYSGGNNARVSIIGNEWRQGPNSSGEREVVRIRSGMDNGSKFFLEGNYSPKRVERSQWKGVAYFENSAMDSTDYYSSTSFKGYESEYYNYGEMDAQIIEHAGARPWDRDEVDVQALYDMGHGTGSWITYHSEAYYPDLDKNTTVLTIPSNPHQDDNNNGFTRLEEWVQDFGAVGDSASCTDLKVSGMVTDENEGKDNGAIDVAIIGGEQPYAYSWTNGEQSEDISGLSVGTYSLTVYDNEGCSETKSFTVNQIDKSCNLSLSAKIVDENEGQKDGQILLTISGSSDNYSYSWSDGVEIEDRSGLEAGEYSVEIADAEGCQINETYTVGLIPMSVENKEPKVLVSYETRVEGGKEKIIEAGQSYDPEDKELTFKWSVPEEVSVLSLKMATLKYLVPEVETNKTVTFVLEVSDGESTVSKSFDVVFIPYKPEYKEVRVVSIEASDYDSDYYPENILDGNKETRWSAWGKGEWLTLTLEKPVNINFFKVSFYNREETQAMFDLYVSKDGLEWEPVLSELKSCGFSSNTHVFETPNMKTEKEYGHVMLVGNGNTNNDWNSITEMKIYGMSKTTEVEEVMITTDDILEVFPNPTTKFISFVNDVQGGDLKIYNMKGELHFSKSNLGANEKVALDLPLGNYIVQVNAGNKIMTQKLTVK